MNSLYFSCFSFINNILFLLIKKKFKTKPNQIQIPNTKFILDPIPQLKPNLTQISESKTIQPSALEDVDSTSANFFFSEFQCVSTLLFV